MDPFQMSEARALNDKGERKNRTLGFPRQSHSKKSLDLMLSVRLGKSQQ